MPVTFQHIAKKAILGVVCPNKIIVEIFGYKESIYFVESDEISMEAEEVAIESTIFTYAKFVCVIQVKIIMRNRKLRLVAETVSYLIFAICLEMAIEHPNISLHYGKDGGLFSELAYLFSITFTSSILWFRKSIIQLISIWIVSPIIIIFSYLVWFFILQDSGIGFLVIYIILLTILKIVTLQKLVID